MNSPVHPSNKIIWFLLGNPVFTASSRIHGMAVHRELARLGYQSYIAYLPEFTEEEILFDFSKKELFESFIAPGDVIILQKIKSAANGKLLSYFKALGLRLVLIDCDWPVANEVAKVVDVIVCTSQALRDKYRQQGFNASYIEDCPELYFEQGANSKKEKLECIWYGDSSEGRWNEVVWLKQLLSDPRLSHWKLKTISNHVDAINLTQRRQGAREFNFADVQWSPAFLETLKQADVIAIPITNNNDESNMKSANRMLQAMALSLPVICSPLPSYTSIATAGTDAMICSTMEEWVKAFQELENETTRDRVGKAAFTTSQRFSIDKVVGLWIKELGLTEQFKINNEAERRERQIQLSDFFYQSLVIKNPFYAKKMSFTLTTIGLTAYSVFRKAVNRVTKLIAS